ncbi:Lipopolysaccharide-induced tumor necrosis factor-alpha factor homolog [Anthophora retusa]
MDKGMSYPPPPPPGFIPPPPPPPYYEPQPNVVIVEQVIHFDTKPQRMKCPRCQADILTKVESEANSKTHLIALCLCFLGLWCCVPCPYCMESTTVQRHYCPACHSFLGEANN